MLIDNVYHVRYPVNMTQTPAKRYTHIRVTWPTRDKLRGLKQGNEQYEDVILRLLNERETVKSDPDGLSGSR